MNIPYIVFVTCKIHRTTNVRINDNVIQSSEQLHKPTLYLQITTMRRISALHRFDSARLLLVTNDKLLYCKYSMQIN